MKTTVNGKKSFERSKKLKRAEPGRVCKYPTCETRLSTYNVEKTQTCFLHTPKRIPRLRGRAAKSRIPGMDVSMRCYVCAIGLGEWDNEAVELEGEDGLFHWWVRKGTRKVRLCKVQ